MCITARKNASKAIASAKSKWASELAKQIHNINMAPKEAWTVVNKLKEGITGHHIKPTNMKFKMANGGQTTRTDKEHMSILHPHFLAVFKKLKNITWAVLNNICQR